MDIIYYVAWRAIDVGRNIIFGDHSASYSYIPAYFAAAERSNHNSIFFFFLSFLDPVKKNFVDVFCFGVCPVGFKFCRPVLMINGTFFKGKHITN